MPLETFNMLLGVGTLALQIITVALLVSYVLRGSVKLFAEVTDHIARTGIVIAWITVLASSAVTLVHSLFFGLPPCALCWWQRAFLYPQMLLLSLTWYLKRQTVAMCSLLLSLAGLIVALYHHVLQMYPSGGLPCPSTGVSCSQILYLEFGYITYPFMAATVFAFLIVVMLIVRSHNRLDSSSFQQPALQ